METKRVAIIRIMLAAILAIGLIPGMAFANPNQNNAAETPPATVQSGETDEPNDAASPVSETDEANDLEGDPIKDAQPLDNEDPSNATENLASPQTQPSSSLLAAADNQDIEPAAITEIYVSPTGSDSAGDGSSALPYASLAKAASVVNGMEKGSVITVYVTDDLDVSSAAIFYGSNVTITSVDPSNPVTVSRAAVFSTSRDNARTYYNPAMLEIGNNDPGSIGVNPVSLTLKNITFDDRNLHMGTELELPVVDAATDNTSRVQDSIIGSYDSAATVTLDYGATLKNYGGMSAIRSTGAAVIMKSGSRITDDTGTPRTTAKWRAGVSLTGNAVFTMEQGASIDGLLMDLPFESGETIIGSAVLASGATANIAGSIEDVTNGYGLIVTDGEATLSQTGLINKIVNGGGINSQNSTLRIEGTISNLTKAYYVMRLRRTAIELTETGKIIDNVVTQTVGGAIYCFDGSDFAIRGELARNKVQKFTVSGGALYTVANGDPTTVTLEAGGRIAENSASLSGGGVYVNWGSTLTVNGGTIEKNSALIDGGGVYVRQRGVFVMDSGTITDNTAGGYGGGLVLEGQGDGRAVLNGGTIANNHASDGTNRGNDINVKADAIGHTAGGHLKISNEATIGDPRIAFTTGSKTVVPNIDGTWMALGNASSTAVAALGSASTAKGWGSPLATLWLEAPTSTSAFTVSKPSALVTNVPVYALVLPTDETGAPLPGANAMACATEETADGIGVAIPSGYADGCAIALVQPSQDFGALTLSGPDTLKETYGATEYTVPFDATYTLSDSLKNALITDKATLDPTSFDWSLDVVLDTRLSATVDSGGITLADIQSSLFEIKGTPTFNASTNTLTIPLELRSDWATDFETKLDDSLVLSSSGILQAADFQAGDDLVFSGSISLKASASAPLFDEFVPSNVMKVRMLAANTLNVARLFGADRFQTSKTVSIYERGVENTVILASGDDEHFPDALTASALSGKLGGAPIVLTPTNALSQEARSAIEDELKSTDVIIIGDKNAVSENVESTVAALSTVASVSRIGGEDRQATAELINEELGASRYSTAIIARSDEFPDSLTISPWAAVTSSPIFLSEFGRDSLTDETKAALASGGFDRIIVLGDENSTPASVYAEAQAAAGLTDAQMLRLGGEDRYETSSFVAEFATSSDRPSNELLTWDKPAITRGDKHADALTGGALQGLTRSPVLLTEGNTVNAYTAPLLQSHDGEISELRFFGDEYSISHETTKGFINLLTHDAINWKPDSSVAIPLT